MGASPKLPVPFALGLLVLVLAHAWFFGMIIYAGSHGSTLNSNIIFVPYVAGLFVGDGTHCISDWHFMLYYPTTWPEIGRRTSLRYPPHANALSFVSAFNLSRRARIRRGLHHPQRQSCQYLIGLGAALCPDDAQRKMAGVYALSWPGIESSRNFTLNWRFDASAGAKIYARRTLSVLQP